MQHIETEKLLTQCIADIVWKISQRSIAIIMFIMNKDFVVTDFRRLDLKMTSIFKEISVDDLSQIDLSFEGIINNFSAQLDQILIVQVFKQDLLQYDDIWIEFILNIQPLRLAVHFSSKVLYMGNLKQIALEVIIVFLFIIICFAIQRQFRVKFYNQSQILIPIQYYMTTYKEKYHLKKTEPIKAKPRISYLNYVKEPVKPEKASTIPQTNNKRVTLRDRYSNHLNRKYASKQKDQLIKKSEQYVKPVDSVIRAHSVSSVRKVNLNNKQPLEYWKKDVLDINFDILSSVQNFFNKIIKPDNGCTCDQPCQWAGKFFKWVDIPQFLVIQHYNSLMEKLNEKTSRRLHGVFDHFVQDQEEKIKQKLKCFKQIRKDIERTQSQNKTFQNPIFRRRLQNILKCYVIQDLKVGYVQGMNMVLSGILYHIKDEAKSYAVFRKLLYSIRSIYLDNFAQCYIHVNRIQELLKLNLFDVYQVLQEMQVELSMICLPWILSLLSNIVPLEYLHLIYYGFMKDRWNFIYRTSLSIFIYFKQQILDVNDGSQILSMLSASQNSYKQIDWEDIIKYGQKVGISFS